MGTTKKEYKHIITAFTLHLTEEKLQFIILHEKKKRASFISVSMLACVLRQV